MKICPSCREEFLDQIASCNLCDQILLNEEEAALLPKYAEKLSKEEILSKDVLPLLEGNLDVCREIEFYLNKAKVPCVVYPVKAPAQNTDELASMRTFVPMKYVVLVPVEKIEHSREVLHQHFVDQVAREGNGHFISDTVDTDSADATCPACGRVGSLELGECSDCGLFLGGES